MSDFLQRIGQQAVKLAPGPFLKLLLYCEVQDGVMSAGIFFQIGFDPMVRHRRAPPELRDLICEFWENGYDKIRPRSWAAMRFWVEGGELESHFIYAEDLDRDERLSDRGPRVVAHYFPLTEVDYSKADEPWLRSEILSTGQRRGRRGRARSSAPAMLVRSEAFGGQICTPNDTHDTSIYNVISMT